MTYFEWLPSLVTSTVLTGLAGLGAWALKLSIEKSVQSSFDVKLERVKSELRKSEEELRADLRKKDTQIENLRRNALVGAAARQDFLEKKNIDAIEQIWESVIEKTSLKLLSNMIQSVNMDAVLSFSHQENKDGEGTRRFVDFLSSVGRTDQIGNFKNINKYRPFVSPIIWSLNSAYNTVLMLPVIQLAVAKSGMDGKKAMKSPDQIFALVKAVLPHRSDFIDKHGSNGLSFLVDEIEEKLLAAIREDLEGKQADEAAVKRADEIIKLADALAAEQAARAISVPEELQAKV